MVSVNKRKLLFAAFIMFVCTVSFGQGTTEGNMMSPPSLSPWLIRANILPTGIAVERAIFYSTSVEFGGGLTYDGAIAFYIAQGNPVFIWANPYLNIKLNQYIGRGRMEMRGRPTYNNAGTYISLDYQYTFPPTLVILQAGGVTDKVNSSRYMITYGSKSNLGRYFQFGGETGLGVIVNDIIRPTYKVKMYIAWIIDSY